MPESNKKASRGIQPSKWLMIGALVVAILIGISRLGGGLLDQSGSDAVPEPDCTAAISWDEAEEHEGSQETVRGPVVSVTHVETVSGQPTFVNMGLDHPDSDRFTVVIWNDVRAQFDQDPEMLLAGQDICVAGDIQIHDDGSSQIVLDGPGAIQITD